MAHTIRTSGQASVAGRKAGDASYNQLILVAQICLLSLKFFWDGGSIKSQVLCAFKIPLKTLKIPFCFSV